MLRGSRVLVVEDEALIAEELRERLSRCGALVEGPAFTASEALASIGAVRPDLVLLDIRLGGGDDGIGVAEVIRREFDVPIVFVSACSDDLTLHRARAVSPLGYLIKPVSDVSLKAAVLMALERHAAERETRAAAAVREAALEERAARDGLTRLWNRTRIVEMLEDEIARAARDGRPLSLFMMDVDLFKEVNDTHGHHVADEVLVEVGRRLTRGLRRFCALGRYGGDEFVAIVPDADQSRAGVIAERLRRAVGARPVEVEGALIAVTLSVGAFTASPDRLPAPRDFVAAADRALYESKLAGRDRVSSVSSPVDALIVARIRAEYAEVPGLSLTLAQAQRLWSLDERTARTALEALADDGVLRRSRRGAYARCLDG